MKRWLAILVGAVITAAFFGPGTVTTAAQAGASYRLQLLWPLVFATLACIVLQEASARLTIHSGRNLGEALRFRFAARSGGWTVRALVVGAIVGGCAAYQAGNILGGVAGLSLMVGGGSRSALTLASALAAGLLLWFGNNRQVAQALGLLVAAIGIAFFATSLELRPSWQELCTGLFWPRVPAGSGLLILGLVGTTVVPYNLFLGSSLARGHAVPEMRLGLILAIGLGGVLSMAVVVVGSAIVGSFTFDSLAQVLSDRLGSWAYPMFGLGLFAAGFSSAITAPLAAAMTARSLFAQDGQDLRWDERSWRYRTVWLGVLATGLGFGLSGVKPIPVIIVAQALNGVLLPLVAVFLLVAVNERQLMGEGRLNRPLGNAVMSLAVAVTVLLGISGLAPACSTALGLPRLGEGPLLTIGAVAVAALALPVWRWVQAGRQGPEPDRASKV